MTNNKQFDRYFFVLGGATMPAGGGSLNLAKGQVGIFSLSGKDATKDGQKAISSFAGRDKDNEYVIKTGRGNLSVSRSTSNKGMSSVPFSVRDVVSVSVSAPKTTEQKVDDVILGYNGIEADTAINLIRADRKKITVEVSGELVGMYGYPDNKFIATAWLDPKKYYGTEVCEEGDNCEAINARPYVLEAIEDLRETQLRGGIKLEELIDITPVDSSVGAVAPVTEARYYQSLTINDTGDQASLALVQAQYPNNKILRSSRNGLGSVYETITETNTLLTAYNQTSDDIFVKSCEDCPAIYDEVLGGVVYSVKLEDDGVDLSTTVDNLPGYVTGTVKKLGQYDGRGVYSILLDDELTDAEITTFLATNAVTATAQIAYLGQAPDVCVNEASTAINWVLGDSCDVAVQNYTLVLADNECGENRLAELQAHYPDNNIIVAPSVNSTRALTLTGTSGTANVTVAGVQYLATFDTNLTTTAANFVTAHGAAIKTATGATVTSAGAVITFTDATVGFPAISIANATTNLAGTLGAVTVVPSVGGCQTMYQAEVITNMVCDECDPIYADFFTSEAPRPYMGAEWKLVELAEPTSSLMGIRFRGKKFEVRSNEFLRDKIGFIDSSVMIRVSGGHLEEVREGIGELKDEPMAVTYLSRWEPRTHMGGEFQWLEKRDRMYFTGEEPHNSALTRVLFTEEESVIDQSKQYVDYAIEIKRDKYSTQPAQKHHEAFIYHLVTDVTNYQAVENLVNALAGAAGISGVRAFGN